MLTSQEFEALYKNAGIGILVLDAQGKIILANECILNKFGLTQKELHGIEVSLTPYVTNSKNIFAASITDTNLRRKLETELLSAMQKQKELNELKSRFVSIASHEFRTPLSTILSSVYLIEKYKTEKDQNKRNKHIERIISSVKMLDEILSNFLSVGKIEDGKVQVNKEEFNIVAHIGMMLADLKCVLKTNQIINFQHSGDHIIYTDPLLMKHIIINLASNAIKFSPEGSIIQINTQANKDSICMKIKDEGIGIPENDLMHLFELFYRGSNAMHIQGTGIGLHVVKKYLELLQGEIEYKSLEGRGTEFNVIIHL